MVRHGTLLARHFFASRSAHVAPAWGSLAKWIIKLKYSWRAHHVDVSKRTWAGIEEYQSEDSNYLLFTRVSLKLLSRGVRSRTIKSLQTRYFHQSRFVQSNKKKSVICENTMDGECLVPRVYIKKRTPCSMDSSSVISLDCVPRITTPRFSRSSVARADE